MLAGSICQQHQQKAENSNDNHSLTSEAKSFKSTHMTKIANSLSSMKATSAGLASADTCFWLHEEDQQ